MDNSQVTFDDIRNSIVTYLSENNKTLADYNFDAPVVSVLMDALAYTSYYLIRYANFSLTECFLDSAKLRHNVVAHSQTIGYFPYQTQSAIAKLRIVLHKGVIINNTKVNALVIPEGTIFYASSNATTYNFITPKDYYFNINNKTSNGNYYCDITIVEGTFTEETFTQLQTNKECILVNENIDTDYITVRVFQNQNAISNENNGTIYTRPTSLADFSPTAQLYYIKEGYDGNIHIYFGDGKLSCALADQQVVKIKYLVSNGEAGNNISTFNLKGTLVHPETDEYYITNQNLDIVVLDASQNGSDKESIESIKLNAPLYYQAQDRAVTTVDYKALIQNKFGGWINSMIVWGGEEDVEEPEYGSVFICIKPKYSSILSTTQKEVITEYMSQKMMPCIDIILKDPKYIILTFQCDIDWNIYDSSKSPYQMQQWCIDTIKEFFKTYQNTFSYKFKYSNLIKELSKDSSIDNILSSFTLTQYIVPNNKFKSDYTLYFFNQLVPGTIKIGPWNKYSIIDEDGYLQEYLEDVKTYNTVGTVDYTSGTIYIKNYLFKTNSLTKTITVVVTPKKQNIELQHNYLLLLNEENITVNITEKR